MCKLGYGHTLNSYFFVFVCHYYISRRIHTHKRIVLLLVKIFCCSHLSLCFERAIEHLSLKKKEVSIEEKRGTSLSFTPSSRLPDPSGEISQSSFFLSRFLSTRRLSFTNTRRAVEHQRSSLTGKRSLSSFRAVKAFFLSRSRRKNVSLFVILSFQL